MSKIHASPAARATAIVVAAFLLGCSSASAQVLGPRPPQAESAVTTDWRSVLAGLKLTPIGEIERKKHHSEVEATLEDGRQVSVTFDRQGRIAEIEDESHEHDHRAAPPSSEVALDAARRAGFQGPTVLEKRKRHIVVRASTSSAETVDLHIDGVARIYRQIWVRP